MNEFKLALMAKRMHEFIEAMGHGERLKSPGMKDTPMRVARAWAELTRGYSEHPTEILQTTFPSERYDEMICLSGIEFYSVCEHHLLPFIGEATVGYLPTEGRVVGLSKLARLVDCYARRFQIQERMTVQIADAIDEHLKPKGIGVHLKATHLCMTCRGVQKNHPSMITTVLRGAFKEQPASRAEFLRSVP